MDKIIMKSLTFYGYHGVLSAEKVLGQKFILDIELYLNLKKAGITDNVEDTVSYAEVYELIQKIVENKSFNLIEALAENIAETILHQFPRILEIKVIVYKPQAPVKGNYDYFAVEIRRKRDG